MLTSAGFVNETIQNITKPQITTNANQIKIRNCLVHHKCSSAHLLLPNISTKFAEQYIIPPPMTAIKSQSTIRTNITTKHQRINIKIADNGTWTRTSRAEVCYATPTTSYPHIVFFCCISHSVMIYKKI